jgi:rhodanese-related sulfurtransferase
MSKKSQKTNLKKAAASPASKPASKSASKPISKPASKPLVKTAAKTISKTAPNYLYWTLGSLVVLAVLITGAVLLSQNTGSSGTNSTAAALPQEISVQEAYAMRQDGAFILDVRQPEEWTDYHIPGSTLIPLGELQSRLSEVPKDQEVVVVCRSGNRSLEGRDILANAGFTQVTSMAGGVSDWRSNGYETVTGP